MEDKKMRKYLVVGSLSLLFIIGCASTATYFIAPDFTGERLISRGIVVLPLLVGESRKCVFGTESYCGSVGEELASGLRREQPALKVLGPTVVSYILDKEDLMGDYSKLIEDYETVATFGTDVSRKLSRSLGVEYFMLSRIQTLYSVGNDAEASISVQIWSAEGAKMVFESNAEYKAVGSYVPPYDRAMTGAVHKILDRVILVLWGEMPMMYPYKSTYTGRTENAIAQEGS